MSKLFEFSTIKGMSLANRFVRSATWEGMAGTVGSVTPALVNCMRQLAEGQVGLIISSHAYIGPEGQAGPKQLGIYKDDLIDGLKQMTMRFTGMGVKLWSKCPIPVLGQSRTYWSAHPRALEFEGISPSACREMRL